MSASYNRVILAGTLTRDPQMRFLANEKCVANFGIAINRRYRTADGEQREEVTFVDIEAWGRTGENVGKYLTKGKQCLVEGRLKFDSYEDNNGNKRTKLSVVADVVQFLGGNEGKSSGESRPGQQPEPASSGGGFDDSEPPFLSLDAEVWP